MDGGALLDRMWASMKATFGLFAQASPASDLVELDGVTALVVPVTPGRSVLNAVLYDDVERLRRNLDELAAIYTRAGVRAWTVWVHPGDEAARRLLQGAGHKLDATPAAMGRELERTAASMPEGVEWTHNGDLATLTDLNDVAYGWQEERPWSRALSGLPADAVQVYTANVQGQPACGLMTHDHDGDCDLWLVATLPAARGRGLATALLGQALADARDRGCQT
ncbi:MAG: GNAT family N-acetyltransferase, partial [Actinomycetota bacterium]|nr:GNAT family N-acetyltransferase [Actinomycetota bacterium]